MRRVGTIRIVIALFLSLLGLSSRVSDAQSTKMEATPPGRRAGNPEATTTDLSQLKLRRNILTIRLEKGFFEVVEMMSFENQGGAPIVSKDGAPTLRFVLPRSSNVRNPRARWGAAPVGLDPKLLTFSGDELRTSEVIPAGRKFVVLIYRLEDEFGGIRVEKPILYDTPSFAVLPEKDRVQASAPALLAQPPVTFQNREYDRLVGTVSAGSVMRIDMQAPDSMGGLWVLYVVGSLVVAVGLGLGLYVRKKRNAAFSAQVEREEVLRAIASLDDGLAEGNISSDEHARERPPRFERLKELSS